MTNPDDDGLIAAPETAFEDAAPTRRGSEVELEVNRAPVPAPPVPDLVPLAGDWALWRDFAVRSAGFAVSGLDLFGAEDESAQLAEVAADPQFAEAVIWQNRSAYRTAVAKIAGRGTEPGNKRRQRDGVVAGYWQRYCSKNDTIGFFGALAWGAIRDGGPALEVHSRALVAAREVHFETWGLEALAQMIDPSLVVPLNRRPEIELRMQLEQRGLEAGLQQLARLEAARGAVSQAARGEGLLATLDAYDACFEELIEEPPVPTEEGAEGGRTPLYLDCMRDLDVDLGPAVVAELATTLPLLLEASRWWCGRAFAHSRAIIAEALADGPAEMPLGPLYGRVFGALWQLPRLLGPDVGELQRRCAAVVDAGDAATIAARAAAAFTDHGPGWPLSVNHSADVLIAAADLEAIEAGEFRVVIGDFHGGTNPLQQGLFSTRFPDPDRFRALVHAGVGEPIVFPGPPRTPAVRMSARNMADFTNPDDIHLLGPNITPVHVGYESLQIADLIVRGEEVIDPAGTFRAPLTDLFFMPMFVSALKTFRPFPEVGPRITVGRTVLRRATWSARAADRPADACGMATWAAELGLPQRAFSLPSGQTKPVYVDFKSPALTRNLHRMLGRVTAADSEAQVHFSEMLPGPEECWLEHEGARYTTELRIVAVDRTRRGHGTVTA
ncbi:MAG: lantibiotic dehydratase [Solirubrobacteraceae bacterium]